MSQSSIIIHKGGKEEKYEIYVEDYVLSFLKAETGTLELSEFFYGFKENMAGNTRYMAWEGTGIWQYSKNTVCWRRSAVV